MKISTNSIKYYLSVRENISLLQRIRVGIQVRASCIYVCAIKLYSGLLVNVVTTSNVSGVLRALVGTDVRLCETLRVLQLLSLL